MSFFEIDARGLACPKPVLETKKALSNLTGEGLITIVDNEIAVENVKKLLSKLGNNYEIEEGKDIYKIKIFNEKSNIVKEVVSKFILKDESILFTSDEMGLGNDELGKVLMTGYIYTLTEMEELPKYIMFVNSAVRLTTIGSKCIDDIKKLEEKGVEILSCGTCLDFLKIDLKDLQVGSVTNMYTIVDNTINVKNTITIG
jgi:selenium metabolism protein YedF